MEEFILAGVPVKVLAGNRWCTPKEENFMKESFGIIGAELREPASREWLNTFELTTSERCHLS